MTTLPILFLALAAAQLPQTAAGRHLGAWLSAVNSGDAAKIRTFRGADQDAGRKIGQDLTLAWDTGSAAG